MPRDAIKIKNSVSQGFVVAGRPFSITTTVMNPYDQKVEILSYLYHIPFQVQWINDNLFDAQFKQCQNANAVKSFFSKSPLGSAVSPPGQIMFFANNTPGAQGVVHNIAAGEAHTYSFRAIIPQWLFVSGGQLTFPGTIIYRVGDDVHTSPFEVTFPFRPPQKAIILGAIVGASLGSLAKVLNSNPAALTQMRFGEFLTATLLAVILSIIGVVYSSRRSNDVQPVLTVEDVWGGIILGFLIGYLGNEFFQQIVPLKAEAAPAP